MGKKKNNVVVDLSGESVDEVLEKLLNTPAPSEDEIKKNGDPGNGSKPKTRVPKT